MSAVKQILSFKIALFLESSVIQLKITVNSSVWILVWTEKCSNYKFLTRFKSFWLRVWHRSVWSDSTYLTFFGSGSVVKVCRFGPYRTVNLFVQDSPVSNPSCAYGFWVDDPIMVKKNKKFFGPNPNFREPELYAHGTLFYKKDMRRYPLCRETKMVSIKVFRKLTQSPGRWTSWTSWTRLLPQMETKIGHFVLFTFLSISITYSVNLLLHKNHRTMHAVCKCEKDRS